MNVEFLIDVLLVMEGAIIAAGAVLGRDIRFSLACFACVAAMRVALYFMDRR